MTPTFALVAVLALIAGGVPAEPELPWPDLLADPGDRRDACAGREGWVGDGEDGRDPPECEGPDADEGADPAGLGAPR